MDTHERTYSATLTRFDLPNQAYGYGLIFGLTCCLKLKATVDILHMIEVCLGANYGLYDQLTDTLCLVYTEAQARKFLAYDIDPEEPITETKLKTAILQHVNRSFARQKHVYY